MQDARRVKLFRNGASQAVRLPAEFRFEGDEIYASRDELTGDVTLSKRAGASAWKELFQLITSIDVPDNFMAERPMNVLPVDRRLFEEKPICDPKSSTSFALNSPGS